MFVGIRRVIVTAACTLGLGALAVPPAQANVLSLLPGSCGGTASQPFASYGDNNSYVLVPGGDFQPGGIPWLLTNGATVANGSLALPTGSTATSPATCTSIYRPTLRLFVRNTGATTSHLTVQALYPGLLGSVQTATIGRLTGSSSWSPSPAMTLTVQNLLATLSLNQTVIAFRFMPADSSGHWSISNVYIDPFGRR